ncbi:haloacid dehalogenase-like hydrolase [Winogradskyella jejuensis]|uniref:Phosphoserine phosphatase n=1 Tax=Winogradskyella jejuensis TaxID=1089305 RepID=A0A1M5S8C5_9FLAO|nr:HAD family hydrolase [Winogradskyella jejuensis]SHH34695.1 Phosphoserine phosphatase [Winogradskyella jejuensis]
MNKKVLVVDLDGTLYNTNTFHEFLKFLLSFYFNDFRLFKLKYLIVLMKLRFLRLISHARLKYEVLKLIRNEAVDFEAFVSELSEYRNEFEEVSDASFDIKILATAAPSCYAELIAKHSGFDVCLATDFPENGFSPDFENLREQKKNNLLKYLESKAVTSVDVFITDHIDDASITQLATKNIIINPDVKFSNWLKENLVNFETRKIT